jgi:surfeit locus 1 family protein
MALRRASWVIWLAALLAIGSTVRLGLWQLDRAAQKMALHEARQQQGRAPVLSGLRLPRTASEARSAEHRRVAAQGRWLASQVVYLDNRPMAGRAGFFVMTPLELDEAQGGGIVLVQRGFWPRDARERTRIDAPPPPAGPVQLQGRVALAPSRLYELAPARAPASAAAGTIRQNLDLDAYARETGLTLLPWVLVQLDDSATATATAKATATGDGLARQWPEPAADVHKHYGYAFQWFALAALLTGLVVWFQLIRPWRA